MTFAVGDVGMRDAGTGARAWTRRGSRLVGVWVAALGLLLGLALVAGACGSTSGSVVTGGSSQDGDSGSGDGSSGQTAPDDPSGSDPTDTSDPADSGAADPEPAVEREPVDPDAPAAEWVAGVNAAGWDFHLHLEGNAVSSPTSIGVAFSLARAGASTDTGETLDTIFGFPAEGTHAAANAVDSALQGATVDTTTLEIANRLFPDDDFAPLEAFLEVAGAQYGAGINTVDTADGAAAAEVINAWVSATTRGLIPMIVRDSIVQDQRLILVNTVYLKADWLTPFLPEYTADGPFTRADGSTVTTPMMQDRVPVERRYAQLEGAVAVELPYEAGDLAMWLIVPDDPDGLADTEAALDATALAALGDEAATGTVSLTMPKWEQTLPPADLFEWLCPKGFCEGAGFSGIAPEIFVTSALHSAKVIVDEKGTEAAAATSMGFTESMPPQPDLTVIADRPFLWAIVHAPTDSVVFVGRLVDPTA